MCSNNIKFHDLHRQLRSKAQKGNICNDYFLNIENIIKSCEEENWKLLREGFPYEFELKKIKERIL